VVGGGAADDRKVLLDALADLGEHATREGVWLALEPINRYEDYMINRLEQAVDLAAEAGLTLVGFLRAATMNVYAGVDRVRA